MGTSSSRRPDAGGHVGSMGMRRERKPASLAIAVIAGLFMVQASGCGSLGAAHRESKIPHLGEIDPAQPHELQMASLPPYTVEPPDELEISAKPAALGLPIITPNVQADGMIDLGYFGDVYVSGLSLTQIEKKVSARLAQYAADRKIKLDEPIEVSVRLVNGSQSNSYYVLGTVTTQGKFPITGNETVLDAILTAGLRSNSLPEKAYLVRPHPPGEPDQILLIDWVSIKERGDALTNYQIMPGDRIIVPGGKPPSLLRSLFSGG